MFNPVCYQSVREIKIIFYFTGGRRKQNFIVELQKEEDGAICKDHSLSLEFYCTICKGVICMDCFLLLHKQHETKTIKHGKNEEFFWVIKHERSHL